MEHIGVFFVDMPTGIRALTVKNSDDSYTILINAGLSAAAQCDAYDHEMGHINNHDFDHIYDINTLELIRHGSVQA